MSDIALSVVPSKDYGAEQRYPVHQSRLSLEGNAMTDQLNTAAPSVYCEAECQIEEWWAPIPCCLDAGHEHEHEANFTITVADTRTPAVLWWGDDGHAFVGSNKAVDTGFIGE